MLPWILRLTVTLLFLAIFLIRGTRAWGIGLLTLSAMLLLDALRSRGLLDEVGFFGYVLGGLLAGGAFLWLTALFRPTDAASETLPSFRYATPTSSVPPVGASESSAFDRQLLFEQIRDNLGADDVLDLVFDLDLKENELVNPAQPMPHVIMSILDQAEANNQLAQVALSVERILTPMPSDHLPRKERISAETPTHLLRQYLIQTHSLQDLTALAASVGVDWQALGSDAKKSRVRRLLLHAKRRGQMDKLVAHINPDPAAQPSV